MESVKDTLSEMADMFKARMSEFQQELQKSTSPVTAVSLAAEFNSFKEFIFTTLSALHRQVEFLSREMDRLEMKKRRNMILLHGVKEEKSEDTTARVTSLIAEYLDLPNFSSSSIKLSYRLGRPSDNRSRPIVVKFTDISVRDKVWFAKTKFKGTGITQSEFLTKARHDIFLTARQRYGIGKCWTREGRIYVVTADGSRHQVESSCDLKAISHSPNRTLGGDKVDAGSKSADSKTIPPRTKRITRK